MKTELEGRTTQFSVKLIFAIRKFPRNLENDIIKKQLLRSGTSVGANYREANRAETKQDFIYKISLATKEASETQYWLEILKLTDSKAKTNLECLMKEIDEIISILVTISKNAKKTKIR